MEKKPPNRREMFELWKEYLARAIEEQKANGTLACNTFRTPAEFKRDWHERNCWGCVYCSPDEGWEENRAHNRDFYARRKGLE